MQKPSVAVGADERETPGVDRDAAAAMHDGPRLVPRPDTLNIAGLYTHERVQPKHDAVTFPAHRHRSDPRWVVAAFPLTVYMLIGTYFFYTVYLGDRLVRRMAAYHGFRLWFDTTLTAAEHNVARSAFHVFSFIWLPLAMEDERHARKWHMWHPLLVLLFPVTYPLALVALMYVAGLNALAVMARIAGKLVNVAWRIVVSVWYEGSRRRARACRLVADKADPAHSETVL